MGQQIFLGEAFQSLLVAPARTTPTIEPMMFIEKLGEELLSGGF